MGLFDFLRRRETRGSTGVTVTQSAEDFFRVLGLGGGVVAGETVTLDSALGVPGVWCAVNFLASTMAGLPLDLYEQRDGQRRKLSGPQAELLGNAVNDEMTSYDWRLYTFQQVFTGGRAYTYIERDGNQRLKALWPLEPNKVTPERVNGRMVYHYGGNPQFTYPASDIIDLAFLRRQNMVDHYSPILSNRYAIGRAQAMQKYGGRYFSGGGVPPFVIEGPMSAPGALDRASAQVSEAVARANENGRVALALPSGHKVTPLGTDPSKGQMVEASRFMIEEIARIYQLPPVFLQDLTRATFSNAEQQDLSLVKHTLRRWVKASEQEINLKLFRRTNRRTRSNIDGLLRGDFVSRMQGYATSIQHAVMTPQEARRMESLPDKPDSDELYLQGAMVPIGQAGQAPAGPADDGGSGE